MYKYTYIYIYTCIYSYTYVYIYTIIYHHIPYHSIFHHLPMTLLRFCISAAATEETFNDLIDGRLKLHEIGTRVETRRGKMIEKSPA